MYFGGMGWLGFLIIRFFGFYNCKEVWVKEVIIMNIVWMFLDVYFLINGIFFFVFWNVIYVYLNKLYLYINNKKWWGKGYIIMYN